ncbi:MAG TPA: PAS domain S-box protein [Gemmatimonadaceae bacterium]|nr:PAS domain S-box protein [Gemmatimonadaceae bacterium]
MPDDGSRSTPVGAANSGQLPLAQALLDVANVHFATYVTNAPGMIYQFVYLADGGRKFTVVSEASRTLVGVAPGDILRDPNALFGLVHPEDQASLYESGAASRDALAPWSWEGRVILASGEQKWIRAGSRLTPQPDGSIVCDGVLMDVTALRTAATRLEESEQRYRSLFDHHPDAVFSLDVDGKLLSANPACERLCGFAPSELIGRTFAPFLAQDQVEHVRSHFKAAVAGEAQSFEAVIRHRTGRRVDIDAVNIPIVVGGQVTGVFGIVRDMSERRALESQLRQAQKMEAVGQLAGGVAHDFNNILAAIMGFAELLMQDLADDEPRRSDVEEILKSARLGAGLTRQLLAFSRKQVLQPSALDLNEVVSDIATMLRPLLVASMQLVTNTSEQPVRVVVDRSQLEQVLLNLALNARDAMPQGGMLTVAVGMTKASAGIPSRATLTVSDTGVGMEPQVAARAFEPFYTTKPTGEGTGLGLATVHGIVSQSGGSIRIDTAPHRGTTFHISLPLADMSAATKEPAAGAAPKRRGGTVLVAEDEPTVRAVAHRVLERAGYHVLVARDGADALRILNEHGAPVDLLLSDVVMPELGGVELAAIATHRFPALRVVLMSGYADADVGPIGPGEMVERFVAKPFTATSLLEAVDDVAMGGVRAGD